MNVDRRSGEVCFMNAYCKNCQCSHAVWTRLNDAVVCGRCGARERELRVQPVNAERRPTSFVNTRNHNAGPNEQVSSSVSKVLAQLVATWELGRK
jgi:hypothetical protein